MKNRPETKSETGSVTHWIKELNAGDKQQAQHEIYNRFFARLAALARNRMPIDARREADEQDVALSALDSFFQRVDRGEFSELSDRTGLWPLLARITAFKASRQITRERAAKRGGHASNDIANIGELLERLILRKDLRPGYGEGWNPP